MFHFDGPGLQLICVSQDQFPQMKPPLVSIIVVNWNARRVLESCLASIKCTKYLRFSVTVVDNGSTDNSVSMIRSKFPNVRLIPNRENLGFSRANNQGIRLALRDGAEYILLLNNDTEVREKDWLSRIVKFAETDRRIGIIGPRLVYPDGSEQVSAHMISPLGLVGYVAAPLKGGAVHVDDVVGAVLLIKRAVIERIGLLDEGYSPFLYEETDYCMRAKRAGFKVVFYPSVTIVHNLGFSLTRVDEARRLFVSFRNIARFRLLNYPLRWLLPSMAALFLGAFIERKDTSRFAVNDVIGTTKVARRMMLIMRALLGILINLDEIVALRIRNRIFTREA